MQILTPKNDDYSKVIIAVLIYIITSPFSFLTFAQDCPANELKYKTGEPVEFLGLADSIIQEKPGIDLGQLKEDVMLEIRKKIFPNLRVEQFTKFHSDSILKRVEKYKLAYSELIMVGEVVEINRSKPTDQCLFLKTSYEIRVDTILFNLYDIKVNDTVQLRSAEGIAGDACIEGGDIITVDISHYHGYELGNQYLFAVSNVSYYFGLSFRSQYLDTIRRRNYYDPLCPNIFTDNVSNALCFDLTRITEFEKFLKNIYDL